MLSTYFRKIVIVLTFEFSFKHKKTEGHIISNMALLMFLNVVLYKIIFKKIHKKNGRIVGGELVIHLLGVSKD